MKVLITGAAGFIGSTLAKRLLGRGDEVIGVDNLNDYYDVNLKEARLARISSHKNFTDIRINIEDREELFDVFKKYKPSRVVNLAAQAGVRYSLENPHAYVNTNIVGFLNILEGCRYYDVEHLVFASSSSVYGANTNYPFSIHKITNGCAKQFRFEKSTTNKYCPNVRKTCFRYLLYYNLRRTQIEPPRFRYRPD